MPKKTFSVKKKYFSNFLTNYFLQNNEINKLHTSFCFFLSVFYHNIIGEHPKKHLTSISGKKFEKKTIETAENSKSVLKCGQKHFPNQFLFLKNW